MSLQEVRAWHVVLLASFLVFPRVSLPAASRTRVEKARASYERALHLRAELKSQDQNTWKPGDYEKVIGAFRSVYQADPAYRNTPPALAAIAELYEEMGWRFSTERYFNTSITAYQFLRSQYPQHPLCRNALLAIAKIYRSDLGKPDQARKALEKFIEQYPKSAKSLGVQAELEQIDQMENEVKAGRPTPRFAEATKHPPSHIPEVTDIRRWVGPNYSRIVISVDDEVKFDAVRIDHPDRIVFDLSNTHLSPALAGRNFPVEDGFLRQIRVAQFQHAVTRVVLDVEKIEDYSVFSLPNPFRLVIDVHGARAAVVESRPKPSGPPGNGLAIAQTFPEATRTPRPSRAPGSVAPTRETSSRESAPAREIANQGSVRQLPLQGKKQTESREDAGKSAASTRFPSLPPGSSPTSAENTVSTTPGAPAESGSRTLTRALGLKIGRIVIDPGHGGHDAGTIGPTGFCEKDLVLDVALRLKKLIAKRLGNEVILTRSTDAFIPLEERTAIANEDAADLFISIHANASRDRDARGVETYYLNFTSNPEALEVAARENATSQESVHQLQDLIKKIAMTEKIEESRDFAMQIQHEMSSGLTKVSGAERDRGVKKAPFVVLIGANMPSVLAEISFLTNPRDERLLKRSEHRQRIANALYQGMVRYVGMLGRVNLPQEAAAKRSALPTDPKF